MNGQDSRWARDIWRILFVLLVGNKCVALYGIFWIAREQAAVSRALQVTAAIHSYQALMVDAETGVRGFVISNDRSYLEPYDLALPLIEPMQESLKNLTNDNPGQQELLENLGPAIIQRSRTLQELVETRQSPSRDTALETLLVARGKVEMDGIRDRLKRMLDIERDVLALRLRQAQLARNAALTATAFGGFLSISVLVLASRLIKRDARNRRESEAVLRQSEERFRLMAETLPQLIWVSDRTGQHIFHNPQLREYTGRSPDSSTFMPWADLVHPDDRERTQWRWQVACTSGESFSIEYRLRRHDGVYRWFLGHAVPQRDSTGAIIRWFGSSTDIDDQKQAKEQIAIEVAERTAQLNEAIDRLHTEAAERDRATELLRTTTEELRRSNGELEQFAYVASHDLQEPLRKIQAFADRLKTRVGSQLGDTGNEYVERMLSSASRMRRLIDDLLRFSRVTSQAQPPSAVDLNSVVADVVADLEEAIARLGGTVTVGPLPTIMADPSQMRQLMQNLVGNALKFHKPDTPPVVAIRAETLPRMPDDPLDQPDRPAVRIEVADQGIGFDEAYRERIFQVFQRLHGRNEYEGTGIGLAVVRKIAERHGGTVFAKSIVGRGATFSVVLPLGTPKREDAEAREGANLTL